MSYGGGNDYYYSSNYGGEYYDESATNNEYYAEEYQEQQYGEDYYEGNYDGSENAAYSSDALFYSTKTPFVMHPNGRIDNTYGNYDPISALAVEKGDKGKQIPSLNVCGKPFVATGSIGWCAHQFRSGSRQDSDKSYIIKGQ